jgi:two-component system response regulator QseB
LHEFRVAQVRAEGLKTERARTAPALSMRVLLAEDDPMIGASVRRGLAQDGFAVDWVEDGKAAQAALAERVHDALVLDLGLPRQAGLDVLTAMRRAGDTRPVLITTARDAVADRVAGLDAGADDYLVKPFDLDELSARLRALLRRGAGRAAPKISYGALELDPATREARLAGSPVELSPREFALLAALMVRPGAILSRTQLEDKLYGWNESVESNTVEVHIHALRKKLGAEVIRNVRGVGWMIARPGASEAVR